MFYLLFFLSLLYSHAISAMSNDDKSIERQAAYTISPDKSRHCMLSHEILTAKWILKCINGLKSQALCYIKCNPTLHMGLKEDEEMNQRLFNT